MDKDKILELADVIENHKVPNLGFNMNYEHADGIEGERDMSGHGCGTVACILGWTNVFYGNSDLASRRSARATLGLNKSTAEDLFYPYGWVDFEKVTPQEAATTLRILADTGEVDWSHAESYNVAGDY